MSTESITPALGAQAQPKPFTSVIVVAHDLSATGGVNNFLRIMRRQVRPRARVTRFINGRRKGERGRRATIQRMIGDYCRFLGATRQGRFDALHVNPTLDKSSMPRELMFVWLARLFRRKLGVIVFFRGWQWETVDFLRKSRIARRVFLSTHQGVDRILVLADSFRDALIDLGVDGRKIRVISTMFEGEILGKVLEENLPRESGRLLFLARFLPAKGGVEVLHAIAELRSRFPNIKLVMAGDGPQRAELESLAEVLNIIDIVEFTGYIGGSEKMRQLARAEIFLLPTRHPEGMPNAILEAMAAGQVIISTHVGGIPAIVHDGVNGTLIDEVNPQAISTAVEAYLLNPERASAIGNHNRSLAWREWESSIVSNKIADEYECVALRGSGS